MSNKKGKILGLMVCVAMLTAVLALAVPTSADITVVDNGDGTYTTTSQPDPVEGKDAGNSRYYPDANYGSEWSCGAWTTDAGNPGRGLIEFDVSGLPYPAISAELQMHGMPRAFVSPYGPIRGDVSVYQVTSPWDEMTTSWNTMPSFNGTPIDTETPDTERWYEWDITDLYNDWKSGAHANYGIMLINHMEGTATTGIMLKSSDYEDPSLRPKLVITYLSPPPEGAVGGIVEIQVGDSGSAVGSAADSSGASSAWYYLALAGATAGAIAVVAGASYARRRWLR